MITLMLMYIVEASCFQFLPGSLCPYDMMDKRPKHLEYILYSSIKVIKTNLILLVSIQSWLSAALFSASKR